MTVWSNKRCAPAQPVLDGAISLCTLTTAIGFLGFWPTEYKGLADLGVISAGGMAVAWLLTFTFLPAFYAVVGAPRAHEMDLPTSDWVVRWLIGHRPWVLTVVALGGLVATGGALQSSFDYSVLALKDETSQSMSTLRVLQRENLSTDYQLFLLSEGTLDVGKLENLSSVDAVRSPEDLVPSDQEDKLFVIDDLSNLLWSAIEPPRVRVAASSDDIRFALSSLHKTLVHTQAVAQDDGASIVATHIAAGASCTFTSNH